MWNGMGGYGMGGYGIGGFGWGIGLLQMLLFWGVIIVAIVLVARWIGRGGFGGNAPRDKTPLQILKERYARGEINKDEFEQRKRELGA